MQAREFITEIFQPGKKNWEWVRKDNNYASASFSAGDRTYTWQAHSDNDGPTRWILEFRIQRELADPDKLDVWGKTGTGNSAEVMSTAVDITREFIKEYGDKISEFTFDAKEDSRIGLYAKMIARLLPGWELNQTYNNYFGMQFRLTNPDTNEFTTEAEYNTSNAKEIAYQLKTAGYRSVGSGVDATVWAKDDSHVIKILMPDDLGSKAEQVFRKFYEFSIAHQNLACVPRFNEVNTIDINGKDYLQIEMERLIPIQKGSLLEGVVWFFSDYCQDRRTKKSWDEAKDSLELTDTWILYPYARSSKTIADLFTKQWQDLMYNKKSYAVYNQLYTVMQLLYNTGKINQFGWDLHTENVMQRSNGQPVVTDPWFSEGTS